MRKWFIVLIGLVVIPTIVMWAFLEREEMFVQRTVTARMSIGIKPFTAFLPSDLDRDGKTELLALCGYAPSILILNPFDHSKILQLPPPIGDLSGLTLTHKMKRYPTFHLAWLRLDGANFAYEPFPPQIRGIFKGAKAVDADGNGVTDDLLVVMREGTQVKRWWFSLDESGNWQLKGAIPNGVFVGHLFLDRQFLSDLDSDGKAELIKVREKVRRWRLEIWHYEPTKKSWQRIATSPTFSVAPSHQLSGFDTLWAHDLDGDGRKELIGVWWFAVNSSPEFYFARIFSFRWQGNRLTIHKLKQKVMEPSFDIRCIFLRKPIFECGGERYFLVPKLFRVRLPLPHLISLNPPRFRWWTVEKTRTEIWLLPKGKGAFESSKWQKIAELPGEPLVVGDWDKDGQVEMFLRTGVIGGEPPRAVFARLRGKKVQWTEWSGIRMLPICASPLVEGNKFALFVGWSDRTIERVQW